MDSRSCSGALPYPDRPPVVDHRGRAGAPFQDQAKRGEPGGPPGRPTGLYAKSLLISTLGGVLGVGIANAGTGLLQRTMGPDLPYFWMAIRVDPTVLGFAFGLAVLASLVAGAVEPRIGGGPGRSFLWSADGGRSYRQGAISFDPCGRGLPSGWRPDGSAKSARWRLSRAGADPLALIPLLRSSVADGVRIRGRSTGRHRVPGLHPTRP